MPILIALASIVVLTTIVWLAAKVLPFAVCPICAGVSGTWLWILIGIWSGALHAASWMLVAAIAMGGSAVGIMYQLVEKKRMQTLPLAWKTTLVVTGFFAVYAVVSGWSGAAAFLVPFFALLAVLAAKEPRQTPDEAKRAKELEEKMKGCC